MKLATTCPACGNAITLLRVMAAPTPLHLSCKACKANLRVARPPTTAVVIVALVVVALGAGLGLLWSAGKLSVTVGLLVTVALATAVELGASLYVVRRAELTVKDEGGS